MILKLCLNKKAFKILRKLQSTVSYDNKSLTISKLLFSAAAMNGAF